MSENCSDLLDAKRSNSQKCSADLRRKRLFRDKLFMSKPDTNRLLIVLEHGRVPHCMQFLPKMPSIPMLGLHL